MDDDDEATGSGNHLSSGSHRTGDYGSDSPKGPLAGESGGCTCHRRFRYARQRLRGEGLPSQVGDWKPSGTPLTSVVGWSY